MEISLSIYNDMLDKYFYNGGSLVYVVLYDNSDNQVGFQSVFFDQASGGEATTASSVVFTIDAGDTVAKLEIEDDTNYVIAQEDLTDEVFSTAGTYTINSITAKLEN